MGTDGFEFIEYAAPDPAAMGALFERMGFKPIARHRHKNVTLYRQGGINFIVNAEPDSLRAALRAPARARASAPSPSACRTPSAAYERAHRARRLGLRRHRRPGRAEHPGHQGHRRLADLPRRPLARQERRQGRRHRQHRLLRRGLRAAARRRAEPGRPRPDLHRPPDAQRAPRPHGRVGRVLRAAVQLPRDPLLRHRGPGHRRQEQGHDQPLRQDPHPDQRRRQREGRPDPGVPRPLPRRGHPAHRAGLDRPVRHGRRAARAAASSCSTRSTPTTSWSTSASPATARTWPSCRQRKILVDGKAGELLLQIFSENQLGPIFFEFIQRKGDQGFGEGNFKALFETIELDQMRRGVLSKT